MANPPQGNEYLTRQLICPALFSPEECRRIIAAPFNHSGEAAIGHNDEGPLVVDKSIRNTISHSLEATPANHWVIERVGGLFRRANESFYNFRLGSKLEIAVLEYEPGGFYIWHIDIGQGLRSTRKLSFVAFLSPPEDYSGGGLQILHPRDEVPRDQGTAVIFPSFLSHRVEPVQTGRRFSLVAWAHGDAFN